MNRSNRDLTLGDDDFRAIADLAYRESGLQLVAEKMSMIQSRLRQRLRALNIADFASYADFVCSQSGVEERRMMISALTTNVSHFFRESHHFDALAQELRRAGTDRLKAGGRLRIWSAGCSNGQEAVSIAVTLLDRVPETAGWDVRILATDIDPKVIAFAREALYPERLIQGVPDSVKSRFFSSVDLNGEPAFRVNPEVRNLITFRELNLLSTWPMKGQFDVIFCRNVVIYFDQATQNRLWPRFGAQLRPGGLLFLGHSERIVAPEAVGFRSTGPTTYVKSAQ